MACLGGVARYHVLDGAGCDVAVVGQTCGEGRAVVECIFRQILALLQLAREGPGPLPESKDLGLERREVGGLGQRGEARERPAEECFYHYL